MTELTIIEDEKEPEYDSPNDSKWIVGIDHWGSVFLIEPPNIHTSFLECTTVEDIGLPYEIDDKDPGIYEMICSFWTTTDWESGHVDDYGFDCEKLTPLFIYTEPEELLK